jgi:Type IX secretion system protein PorV
MNIKSKTKLAILVLFTANATLFAQKDTNLNNGRIIMPSFPFLLINNDQQTTGLADASVGLLQYNNSGIDNPAKILYNKNDYYASLNHSNYLGNLVNDMSISSAFLNFKLSKKDAFGLAINNFKGGEILNTDANGNLIEKYSSGEYNIKVNYAKKLSDKLAVGVGMKYINSRLFNGNSVGGIDYASAKKLGVDMGIFRSGRITQFDDKAEYRFYGKKGQSFLDYGISITDIGAKISYNGDNRFNFMPTNLKAGASYHIYTQDKNRFTIIAELNKLLVPTPPIINANGEIVKGQNMSRKSWISGITKSFIDAPNGLSEELEEVIWKIAAEYSLAEAIIFRAGYSNESRMKGNRKNLAFGLGLNVDKLGLNLSYSVPLGMQNPLGNTLRFGIVFNGNFKDKLDLNVNQ